MVSYRNGVPDRFLTGSFRLILADTLVKMTLFFFVFLFLVLHNADHAKFDLHQRKVPEVVLIFQNWYSDTRNMKYIF